MNPIVYAIPIFMLTIVIEFAVAYFRHRKVYDTSDALTSLHIGIISQVFNTFTKLFTIGIYIAVYQAFAALTWPMDSVVLWLLAVVLYDFCYYWNHRLNHEIALLWGGHVVHHSSEYFNLSTALRQSSTSAFFNWMFYLPLAVLGVPPTMFAIVALIDLLYQYWVHTELIDRLGFLEWIFVTPSNHRVHHGQNDYCIDRNYGGIFIIWDRLFGTFADERRDEKVCYGVRKPVASLNPIWGNLHYYVELWREARKANGWRARLAICLAPPGGWTGNAAAHFETERFARFDPGTPLTLRYYVAAHCVTLILMLGHFLGIYGTLGRAAAVAYGAFIVLTTVSLCGLLERLRWAKWLEQTRLVIMAVALTAPSAGFIAALPVGAHLVVAVAALGCLLWLATQDVTRTDSASATA
jgi:sterol desaturase/sphingolipid hydroxylase (fatty acid hydroxylase superfamily)